MLANCSGLVCCHLKRNVEIDNLFEIDIPIEMRCYKIRPGEKSSKRAQENLKTYQVGKVERA